MLVVEIDGGYHDETTAKDIRRQEDPRRLGWTVIRFFDKDAENDAESVGRAIANKLGIPYRFQKTSSDRFGYGKRPGTEEENAELAAPLPSPRCRSTLPEGG